MYLWLLLCECAYLCVYLWDEEHGQDQPRIQIPRQVTQIIPTNTIQQSHTDTRESVRIGTPLSLYRFSGTEES